MVAEDEASLCELCIHIERTGYLLANTPSTRTEWGNILSDASCQFVDNARSKDCLMISTEIAQAEKEYFMSAKAHLSMKQMNRSSSDLGALLASLSFNRCLSSSCCTKSHSTLKGELPKQTLTLGVLEEDKLDYNNERLSLQDLKFSMDQKTDELYYFSMELDKREGDLNKYADVLAKKENRLISFEARLDKKQDNLNKLNSTLRAYESDLSETSTSLDDRESTLDERETGLQQWEDQLKAQESSLEQQAVLTEKDSYETTVEGTPNMEDTSPDAEDDADVESDGEATDSEDTDSEIF